VGAGKKFRLPWQIFIKLLEFFVTDEPGLAAKPAAWQGKAPKRKRPVVETTGRLVFGCAGKI
jgi:hypothetical protein